MIWDNTFSASDSEKIKISAFLNEKQFFNRCLILVHGFKGFKDWGYGPYACEFLANKGFFVISFNFSHNGVGENKFEFTELEKFAKNTFSREIRELNEIVSAFRQGYFKEILKLKDYNIPLGFIGHSRGGAIAILTSVLNKSVNAVAAWASISKLDRYTERQKKEWRKRGFIEVLNTRTKQLMKLNIELLNDIESNSTGILNIENAVKNLNRPLLIAHGDKDVAVPISEAEQLYQWSDKAKTEFFKLYNTGHTFDIVHPFEGTTQKFERLLDKTTKFFIQNLN